MPMRKVTILLFTIFFSLLDVFLFQFLLLNAIYSIYLFAEFLKTRNLTYLIFVLPVIASLSLGAGINELIKGRMRHMEAPQMVTLGYRIVKVDFGDPYYYCRGFNSKEIRFFLKTGKYEERHD
jgi:hypothetical protein